MRERWGESIFKNIIKVDDLTLGFEKESGI